MCIFNFALCPLGPTPVQIPAGDCKGVCRCCQLPTGPSTWHTVHDDGRRRLTSAVPSRITYLDGRDGLTGWRSYNQPNIWRPEQVQNTFCYWLNSLVKANIIRNAFSFYGCPLYHGMSSCLNFNLLQFVELRISLWLLKHELNNALDLTTYSILFDEDFLVLEPTQLTQCPSPSLHRNTIRRA